MSTPMHLNHLGHLKRVGIVLAVGLGFAAVPVATQAAAVNLATVEPFVVLGGSTVTNTGPSVLNGDLGVAPGTALVGFGLPAVVNGATHANDAVAAQAQSDLTIAYLSAAGQPVAPANDLTGQNLGNRSLTAGAYRFSSSAQLTGPLTLDAQGDPTAQFVFEIGSTLTTASASSVVLANGASACNVFWQVGSSATLGTTTAFAGNVLALSDITLNTGASVVGRMLARTGAVTLDTNTLSRPLCPAAPPVVPPVVPPPVVAPPVVPPPVVSPPVVSPPVVSPPVVSPPVVPPVVLPTPVPAPPANPTPVTAPVPGPGTAPAGPGPGPAGPGPAASGPGSPTTRGTALLQRTPNQACTAGFGATVRGRMIKRVDFALDGRPVARKVKSPFSVFVRATPGAHSVRARVTFTDRTPAKSMSLGYRACLAAALRPRAGASQFTG